MKEECKTCGYLHNTNTYFKCYVGDCPAMERDNLIESMKIKAKKANRKANIIRTVVVVLWIAALVWLMVNRNNLTTLLYQ